MGSSTVSKVWKYEPIGVVTRRPKVGRGNGGSYGYNWWFGKKEKFSGYGNYPLDTLLAVLEAATVHFGGGSIGLTPRQKHVLKMLGDPRRFTECNVLFIRDRDENPNRRALYYVFSKTPEDTVVFNLMLEVVLERPVKYHDDHNGHSFFLGYYE